MTFNYTTCPTCGTRIPTGSRFCYRCGNQMPSPQAAFTSQGRPLQGYNKSVNPTLYRLNSNGEQPSYIPTILITLFFGIFGLIPAARHSQMAKLRGYPKNGYWGIFGGILGCQIVLAGLLIMYILMRLLRQMS
jgi:hypothetical protein